MKITDKDSKILQHRFLRKKVNISCKKVNISSGKYYVKEAPQVTYDPLNWAANELIGYRIAMDIGLICPKYYIVSLVDPKTSKECHYILSEDLNNYGKFKTAENLEIENEDGNSLYTIWDFLDNNYKYEPSLFDEILRMYIIDIFFSITGRFPRNWGFVFNGKEMHVAILDNEEMNMCDYELQVLSSLESDEWGKRLSTVDKYQKMKLDEKSYQEMLDFIKESKIVNLETFLKESSNEFVRMFEEYYEFFTPLYYQKVLEEVERDNVIYTVNGTRPLQIPNKELLVAEYKENYDLIGMVLRNIQERKSRK